jgi:hypothetical protein
MPVCPKLKCSASDCRKKLRKPNNAGQLPIIISGHASVTLFITQRKNSNEILKLNRPNCALDYDQIYQGNLDWNLHRTSHTCSWRRQFKGINLIWCRSHWPRGLRRRSSTTRLLRLWVRISPWTWIVVCCECCVLSGRGLCDELITRPEESYRLWCVVLCDLETSWMRRSWPTGGCRAKK